MQPWSQPDPNYYHYSPYPPDPSQQPPVQGTLPPGSGAHPIFPSQQYPPAAPLQQQYSYPQLPPFYPPEQHASPAFPAAPSTHVPTHPSWPMSSPSSHNPPPVPMNPYPDANYPASHSPTVQQPPLPPMSSVPASYPPSYPPASSGSYASHPSSTYSSSTYHLNTYPSSAYSSGYQAPPFSPYPPGPAPPHYGSDASVLADQMSSKLHVHSAACVTFKDESNLLGKPCNDGCGVYQTYSSAGPFINCRGIDSTGLHWLGNVLHIQHHTYPPPTLTIIDPASPHPSQTLPCPPPQLLYTYKSWSFYRFDLALPLMPPGGGSTGTRKITYYVQGVDPREFWVPGRSEGWHWSFYSCNGFSNTMTELEKTDMGFGVLWEDVRKRHERNPLHVMVGGGDQLYNDEVFDLAPLKEWLRIQDRKSRNTAPFTQEMQRAVSDFYFLHYLNHWMHPGIRYAFSHIPQLNMWDDHDIYDGYGSYPADLMYCPVFQGVYREARLFYLLFQHHTTDRLPARENEIRVPWRDPPCYPSVAPVGSEINATLSIVARIGPSTAIVALDARSCRTIDTIVPEETYDAVFAAVEKMAAGAVGVLQHVVLVTGVPVVYPGFGEALEDLVATVSNLKTQKPHTTAEAVVDMLGIGSLMGHMFDEPMYLDDMRDHWGAKNHQPEKARLILRLQALAEKYGVRISLIGGDVHLACTGRLRNKKHIAKEVDPHYMLQVVSSAIVNTPPPDILVAKLAIGAGGNLGEPVEGTQERLRATFEDRYKVKAKLLNHRNWCTVQESRIGVTGDQKALNFTLIVEPEKKGDRLQQYTSTAPPLNKA